MSRLLSPPARVLTTIIAISFSCQLLSGLTNSDVITLHKAGIGADTIILAINSAEEQDFDVSTSALVALKEASVDESVIQAILLTAGGSRVAQKPEETAPPVAEDTFDITSLFADVLVEQDAKEEIVAKETVPQETVPQEELASDEELLVAREPEIAPEMKQKTPPQPIFRPAPDYPQSLREKGITGSVRVQFTVNTDGNVQDIEVIQSDHDLFSVAATEALSKWKFKPGLLGGEPVDTEVKLSVPFNITQQTASLNRAPKPIFNPKPNYPRSLREQGITGNVIVQVVINASGDVQDIEVLASDNDLFTEEALKVLNEWKYAPALQNGKPISSRVQFSIPFKIRE